MGKSKVVFDPTGVDIQNETLFETNGLDVLREPSEYSTLNVVLSADAYV